MDNINQDELLENAKKILKDNWNGKLTIPSATLYPHQWSWDSCFHAIGNSYHDPERAIEELEYLFDAQWKNGMIPHIVFNADEKTYFPAADFYQVTRSANAPTHVGTSGLTQPPVHAIACYYIYYNHPDKDGEGKEFLRKSFKHLKNFHRYLLTARDPESSGLVTLFHPWESGTDNSPIWDETFSRIKVKDLPKFKRLDIAAVDGQEDMRPSDDTYNKFIYLIEIMKKHNYDDKLVYENTPFKIKDVLFSSILYVANKYLIRIAGIIDEDTTEINEWMNKTERNFYRYFLPLDQVKLGNHEDNLFYDYDLVKRDWIRKKTVNSLVPIYTGLLSKKEVEMMISWTDHAHFCGQDGFCHVPTVPSTDLSESYFQQNTYWRGPVWINTNW
ncbi:MAG: MGH1-like glycoside hydrolase domain-containing protein, partial [Nitrososphaeraceae archaeon]